MDVYLCNSEDVTLMAAGTNDDLFNIAVNEFTSSLLYASTKVDVQYTFYVAIASNGQFASDLTTMTTYQHVGNNIPVQSVAPAYFPVATAGAECAVVLEDSLSWADNNLLTGYDWFLINPQASKADQRYFVTGILNSSQTEANDPFSGGTGGTYPDVQKACCWAGNFVSGVNPFA